MGNFFLSLISWSFTSTGFFLMMKPTAYSRFISRVGFSFAATSDVDERVLVSLCLHNVTKCAVPGGVRPFTATSPGHGITKEVGDRPPALVPAVGLEPAYHLRCLRSPCHSEGVPTRSRCNRRGISGTARDGAPGNAYLVHAGPNRHGVLRFSKRYGT